VLPIVLYLSYMSLLVWCLFLAMGTIGFLSSFLFTYAIFNAAKSVSGSSSWAGSYTRGCAGGLVRRLARRLSWLGSLGGQASAGIGCHSSLHAMMADTLPACPPPSHRCRLQD
jgi:hypothetical protein